MNTFITEQSKWIALSLNIHTISSCSVRTVTVDCGHTMFILHGVVGRRRPACLFVGIEGSSVVPPGWPPGQVAGNMPPGFPRCGNFLQ